MTGRWVDDVMIFHAVLFEIPLIAARSNNRPVGRRENAEIIILRFRTLHGNTPFAAIRFRADNLNVSTEVDEPARHTAFPVNIRNSAGCITLCDSAEVNFHAVLGKADGCAVLVVKDIIGIGQRKEAFDRVIRRNRIISGCKTPGVHDRINCDVENAVCAVIQIQRAFQQIGGILR